MASTEAAGASFPEKWVVSISNPTRVAAGGPSLMITPRGCCEAIEESVEEVGGGRRRTNSRDQDYAFDSPNHP